MQGSTHRALDHYATCTTSVMNFNNLGRPRANLVNVEGKEKHTLKHSTFGMDLTVNVVQPEIWLHSRWMSECVF